MVRSVTGGVLVVVGDEGSAAAVLAGAADEPDAGGVALDGVRRSFFPGDLPGPFSLGFFTV